MTVLPEHPVTAKALKKYDRIFVAGRWRSVIEADLTIPPTDAEIAAMRKAVTEASDEQDVMAAAFALGYAIKRRRQWPQPVVHVHLGTAGTTHFAEYAPDALVTVRRPT